MARSVARVALVLGLVVAAATALLPRVARSVHVNVRWHDGAATDPWGRPWQRNHGWCRTWAVSSGPDGVVDAARWRHLAWRWRAGWWPPPFPRDDVRALPAEEFPWVGSILGALVAGRLAAALLLAVGHLGLPARARRSRAVAGVWVALVVTELVVGARLLAHLVLELRSARRLVAAASLSPLRPETVAGGTLAGFVGLLVVGALVVARDRRRTDAAVV